MGNSYGISLELVGKSDGLFGNVLGMHRGCWGVNVEFIGNYYQFLGNNQTDCLGMVWECIWAAGE